MTREGQELWPGEISIEMMLVGARYFCGRDRGYGKNMKKETEGPFIPRPRGNYGKLTLKSIIHI